jgi:hypothetical protein
VRQAKSACFQDGAGDLGAVQAQRLQVLGAQQFVETGVANFREVEIQRERSLGSGSLDRMPGLSGQMRNAGKSPTAGACMD